jgi:carbon-monoxide dehydrogenase large subunit
MRRREDERLLTGKGRYTADLRPEGLAHACFARTQLPSGRILSIDLESARTAPGVIAILTAGNLAADGIGEVPPDGTPPRDDGGEPTDTPRPLLIGDIFRFQGEPYAMVVAETAQQAADAAEMIYAEVEELPFTVAIDDALDGEAPRLWRDTPDNIAYLRRAGGWDRIDNELAASAHVVPLDFKVSRLTASPMEPRVSLGEFVDGRYVLHTATQSPFAVRGRLAKDVFGVEPGQIRVIAQDVGGSFGMKGGMFSEDALVLWAARRCGRPVLWESGRGEAFLADDHARDVEGHAELGLTADGEFTCLKVRVRSNVGAYFSRRCMGIFGNMGGIAGTYRTPVIAAEVTGIFTNTAAITPYRGAGRPEATLIIERIIDRAAAELDIDPFELRRRNLIPADAMPWQTGYSFKYDSGDFAQTMARAHELAELESFEARRSEAESRGRMRGIGIANPIEVAGGPAAAPRKDDAWIGVSPDGAVELRPGCMSVGQGHETGLVELTARLLGVDADSIIFRQGDTDLLPSGRGSGGSSGLIVGGAAIQRTAEALIEKGRVIAADTFEAAVEDVAFDDGGFQVAGTDMAMTLAEVAAHAADRGEEFATGGEFQPPAVTFPNGCHISEVEVDPETGVVKLIRYVGVEDVGNVVNPVLVAGQMHGGIGQGVGQAMGEAILYDRDSGQLITGSFLDYPMPVASGMPEILLDNVVVPTEVNPLGAKGVGEAGTVGSLAATLNAICNALAPLGVTDITMPATPERVWRAIREAAGQGR